MSLSSILNKNNENIMQHVDQLMMLWEDDRGKLIRNSYLLKKKNEASKKMFKLLREKYDILATQLHRMKPINTEKKTKSNDDAAITNNKHSVYLDNCPNKNISDVDGFVKINYKGKECKEEDFTVDRDVITHCKEDLYDKNVGTISLASKLKHTNEIDSSRMNQQTKSSNVKILPRFDNVNPNKSLLIDSPPSSSSKKQRTETDFKVLSNTQYPSSSSPQNNSIVSDNFVIPNNVTHKLSTLNNNNNNNVSKTRASNQFIDARSSSNIQQQPPPQLSSKICLPSSKEPGKVVKYAQSVRNKSLREIMPGHTCTECNAYYDALRQQGITFNDYDMQEMLRKCSRHKQEWAAPSTPDGFWDCDVNTPDDWKK